MQQEGNSTVNSTDEAGSEECPSWMLVDSPLPAKLLLLLAFTATLLVYARTAWAIYRSVEIAHPVFAVVFQVATNAILSILMLRNYVNLVLD